MDQPYPRPRKRFGQNFLRDGSVLDRIVAEVEPTAATTVLEIGPGRGALTRRLLEVVDRVVAIEVDRDLAQHLRETFEPSRLEVVEGDVLEFDLRAATRWTVVGNLPYNISKPIAMKLFRERRSIDRAVLMFQKEVADRLTATPGTKSYGPLTVLASLTYCIERLFDLRPGAFRPRPKVDSTVTRWHTREMPGFDEKHEAALLACLAASFQRRRQTLRNNLRSALGSTDQAEAILGSAGLDASLRAEAIPPQGFVHLAEVWPHST